MALTLMDGFESAPTLRNGMTNAGTPLAATGRDGVGKALAGAAGAGLTVPLPSNQATTIIGVGVKFATGALAATTGHSISLVGDAGATTHLTLNLSADGRWQLRRGTPNSTIIATASLFATPVDTWGFMELKATINDTTGICIVKWNGVEHINFTGDTRNAGTLASISTLILPAANFYTFDDLYVLDGTGGSYNDFIGDRVIKAARPAANGASSQWLGSDGNSTDNYLLVDEVPFNTTDYVGAATAGQRDSYDCSAVSGLASVDAVQVYAYAAKSDAGARSLKTLARSTGGTVVTSATLPLSTTYAVVQDTIRQTNADGAAWSPSTVNSHEYGVEVV